MSEFGDFLIKLKDTYGEKFGLENEVEAAEWKKLCEEDPIIKIKRAKLEKHNPKLDALQEEFNIINAKLIAKHKIVRQLHNDIRTREGILLHQKMDI